MLFCGVSGTWLGYIGLTMPQSFLSRHPLSPRIVSVYCCSRAYDIRIHMYIIYAAHTVYRCSPLANPTSYHYISRCCISGCCISGCCIRTDDTRMYKCVISAAHIIDTGSANVLVGLRHSLVCLNPSPARPARPALFSLH